jgi:phage tail-like protein
MGEELTMAVDARAIERHKVFKYRVEINGYPVALVQEAKIGKAEIGVSEHAGAGQNHPVKEAGMLSFEGCTLKTVVPLDGPGKTYWQTWLDKIQDPKTGNGMRPSAYRQDFSLYDLDPQGNPIRTWEFKNAWIKSYDPGERKSLDKDKDTIEELVITYEWRELVEK